MVQGAQARLKPTVGLLNIAVSAVLSPAPRSVLAVIAVGEPRP